MFTFLEKDENNQLINQSQQKIWNSKQSIQSFLILCLQLTLASLAIYLFNVEANLDLPLLTPLILVAFMVNALLPKQYRLAFFFFVSLIPIFYVFSGIESLFLIGTGLMMIGTCHLPISLSLRKVGVLCLGAILAYCQYTLVKNGEVAGYSFSSQLFSLLGVMFMFRMIIYLYELKYEKEVLSIWQRLCYFFMLPNICFPIFPIIDYKTFKLTYYNQPDLVIYQRGLNLIVLGVLQLLIYRIIYYLVPPSTNVTDFWGLIYYLVLSYLLLIRLNGILNIVIGFLRLFGFNLPDIFNYMFLAQGFDDYWRRLNIYWKDFMVKIFYYPIYFFFRKKSKVLALVLGTLITFLFNWILHTYQWFWILGKISIRSTEVIVWILLCVFILFAILKQHKTKKINAVKESNKWQVAIKKSSTIFYTFSIMSVIYGLYVSASLNAWINLISNIETASVADWLLLGGIILLLISIGALLFIWNDKGKFSYIQNLFNRQQNVSALQIVTLGILLFFTTPQMEKLIKEKMNYSITSFINHELKPEDKDIQSKGYYEDLLLSDNFSSPLWQIENTKPKSWKTLNKAGLKLEDGLFTSIKPNIDTLFKKARIQTNRWGLRDKEYEKERPPNTIRIAMLGGSLEMGSGVNNEGLFENLVEKRLNDNFSNESLNFEIINFAVSGLSTIRNIEKLRRDALEFNPNFVLVCVHNEEILHFQKTLSFISSFQKDSSAVAKIKASSPWFEDFETFLKMENIEYSPLSSDDVKTAEGIKVMSWGYRKMETLTSGKKAKLLLALMPDINNKIDNYHIFETIAQNMSTPIFNFSGAYDSYNSKELKIATWDHHPNELGHKLIADQLYINMVEYLQLK